MKRDTEQQRPRPKHGGVKKRCGCAPKAWTKCPHPWHFSFKWKGVHYRLSLDKEVRRTISSKTEAHAAADELRTAIRHGRFRPPAGPTQAETMTFDQFAELWSAERGIRLVRPRDNAYRLRLISQFVLPGTSPPTTFGSKPVREITTDDLEAYRDARVDAGRSPVTVNHDLKLLRKMLNWAIRKRLLAATPFKIGTEPAISLLKETPRSVRFAHYDDEARLLAAANPHLRDVLIALLDSACRLGEILSLQWRSVSFERQELAIEAHKEKTRTGRTLPISARLMEVLERRCLGPDGEPLGPEAYVFGNAVGEQAKSVREAWERARAAAGLPGLQLRDLRHEAGSRFDEAGVPTNYVSKMLGHTNLTTTSRYLNIQRGGLHQAMRQMEAHREQSSAHARRPARPSQSAT